MNHYFKYQAVKNKDGRFGRIKQTLGKLAMVCYYNDGNWITPAWEWLPLKDLKFIDNELISDYYIDF